MTGAAGTGASCFCTQWADFLLAAANSAWCCDAFADFLAANGSIFGGVLGAIFPMAGSTFAGGELGSSLGAEAGELWASSVKVAFGIGLFGGLFGGLLGGGDLVTLVELLLEVSMSVEPASSAPMAASFMAVIKIYGKSWWHNKYHSPKSW